jgi:Ca2+-binding EF-hand superfamily protein
MPIVENDANPGGQVDIGAPGRIKAGDRLDGLNGRNFTLITSFDSNGDQKVDHGEIMEALTHHDLRASWAHHVGETEEALGALSDDDIANAIISEYDRSQTGSIDDDEITDFLEMMLQAHLAQIIASDRPMELTFSRRIANMPVEEAPPVHVAPEGAVRHTKWIRLNYTDVDARLGDGAGRCNGADPNLVDNAPEPAPLPEVPSGGVNREELVKAVATAFPQRALALIHASLNGEALLGTHVGDPGIAAYLSQHIPNIVDDDGVRFDGTGDVVVEFDNETDIGEPRIAVWVEIVFNSKLAAPGPPAVPGAPPAGPPPAEPFDPEAAPALPAAGGAPPVPPQPNAAAPVVPPEAPAVLPQPGVAPALPPAGPPALPPAESPALPSTGPPAVPPQPGAAPALPPAETPAVPVEDPAVEGPSYYLPPASVPDVEETDEERAARHESELKRGIKFRHTSQREVIEVICGAGSLGIALTLDAATCLAKLSGDANPSGQVDMNQPGRIKKGDRVDALNGEPFPLLTSFDADGDGLIDRAELHQALFSCGLRSAWVNRVGAVGQSQTDEEIVDAIIAEFDKDGSGVLDGAEITDFLQMMLNATLAKIGAQTRPITLTFSRAIEQSNELEGVGTGEPYEIFVEAPAWDSLGLSLCESTHRTASGPLTVIYSIEQQGAAARACPLAKQGDIITAVNGESVVLLPVEEILKKIIASSRPLSLAFFSPAHPNWAPTAAKPNPRHRFTVTVTAEGSLGIDLDIDRKTCMALLRDAPREGCTIANENENILLGGDRIESVNGIALPALTLFEHSDVKEGDSGSINFSELVHAARTRTLRVAWAIYKDISYDAAMVKGNEDFAHDVMDEFDADGSGVLDGAETEAFMIMMLDAVVATLAAASRPLTIVFSRAANPTNQELARQGPFANAPAMQPNTGLTVFLADSEARALPLAATNAMLGRLAMLRNKANVARVANQPIFDGPGDMEALRWAMRLLQVRSARLALGLTLAVKRRSELKPLSAPHTSAYTLVVNEPAVGVPNLGLKTLSTPAGVFITRLAEHGDVAQQYADKRCVAGDTVLSINGVAVQGCTRAGIERALSKGGVGRPVVLEMDARMRARQTCNLASISEAEAAALLVNLGSAVFAEAFAGEGVDGAVLAQLTSVDALAGFERTSHEQRTWLVGALHEVRTLGVPRAWLVPDAWNANNIGSGSLYDIYFNPSPGQKLGVSVTGVANQATGVEDKVVLGQITEGGACAAACSFASVGDIVMAVNGESCFGLGLADVMAMIIDAGRPFMMSCFTPTASDRWIESLGGTGARPKKMTDIERAADHARLMKEREAIFDGLRADVREYYEATVLSEDESAQFGEGAVRRLLAALRRLPDDAETVYMALAALNVIVADDALLMRQCAADVKAISAAIMALRRNPQHRELCVEALYLVDLLTANAPLAGVVSPMKIATIDMATRAMEVHADDASILSFGERILDRSTSVEERHEEVIETCRSPAVLVNAMHESVHSARLQLAALDKLLLWVETPSTTDALMVRQRETLQMSSVIVECAKAALAAHPANEKVKSLAKRALGAIVSRGDILAVSEGKDAEWM